MRCFVIGFCCGAWLLQQQAVLPGWGGIAACAALALGAGELCRRLSASLPRAALLLAGGALAGFAWAVGWAQVRIADRLPAEWEGRDLVVTGVVAGLPQAFERGLRFPFDVEQAGDAPVPSRLLLSWYGEPAELAVRAGERWRFTVRLKRPRGTLNPHTFDYEAWLLERGIGATGYVRDKEPAARLNALVWRPTYLIERARELVRARFLAALPEHRYAGVLVALAVGDQRAIEPEDWRLYFRTGIGHLMSISGLHVTMVSGLCAALVYAGWRRSPRLALRLPARKAAALGGAVTALAYCLLAGFAVPAQRTLYMLSTVALAFWLDRMQSSSRVLAAALLAVVALDPWAVMSAGFWLSFGAVALMLYVGVLHAKGHWLMHWARIQGAITLGLAPLLLVLFQQVSLIAPLANAVAIPVVSLVVTPLALLAVVTPGAWLLQLAHAVLAALMEALRLLDALPVAVWEQHAPATWTLAPALLGIAWMLAPRGVPARWLGALLLLPLFAVAPEKPAPGAVWLDVLDVGQGQAVLVRTRNHALLYDAGPAYGAADAGDRVVLPYLRGEGMRALDALVVSHADGDHAGGALTVAAAGAPVLRSSLTEAHPAWAAVPLRIPCRDGERWEWDGVRFEFLHPPGSHYGKRMRTNRLSCVLRIVSVHGAALLTGDIEKADEQALAGKGEALRADVLLAPHHGSRSSSTEAFLRAVGARHVLVSAGYRNRFGHPHPDVLARYAALGMQVWRTDRDGTVRVRMDADRIDVRTWRGEAPRYWR